MASPSEKQTAAHSHEENADGAENGNRIQTLAEEAKDGAGHINLSWRSWASFHGSQCYEKASKG